MANVIFNLTDRGHHPSSPYVRIGVTATFDVPVTSVSFKGRITAAPDISFLKIVSDTDVRFAPGNTTATGSVLIKKQAGFSISPMSAGDIQYSVTATGVLPGGGSVPVSAAATLTIDDVSGIIPSCLDLMKPELLSNKFLTGGQLLSTQKEKPDLSDRIYYVYQVRMFGNDSSPYANNYTSVQLPRCTPDKARIFTISPTGDIDTEVLFGEEVGIGAIATLPCDANGKCLFRIYPIAGELGDDGEALQVNTVDFGGIGSLVCDSTAFYVADFDKIGVALSPPSLKCLDHQSITYDPQKTFEEAEIAEYYNRKKDDFILVFTNEYGSKQYNLLDPSFATDEYVTEYKIHIPYINFSANKYNQLNYIIFDGTNFKRSEPLLFKYIGPDFPPLDPSPEHNRVFAAPVVRWTPTGGTAQTVGQGAEIETISGLMMQNGEFTIDVFFDDNHGIQAGDSVNASMFINAFTDTGGVNRKMNNFTPVIIADPTAGSPLTGNIEASMFFGYDSDPFDNPGKIWMELQYGSSNLYSQVWYCGIDTVAPGE